MRVLVYGFGPYDGFARNITERLLKHVRDEAGVYKKVFKVRFDAAMFQHTLNRVRPDCIIGLGQHPRARKLRIERKARNLQRDRGGPVRPIRRGGPPVRFATLALPRTAETATTYDAGSYVCNFSMYLMAEYCERTGARFGFVHVPKDYDLRRLEVYLRSAIRAARSQNRQRN